MTISSTPSAGGLVPDYSRDVSKNQGNKAVSQDPANRGAKLTKDSLDIPLEVQSRIDTEQSEAGRPALAPLLWVRLADETKKGDLSFEYYLQLRASLPERLRTQLTANEMETFEAERDPSLIALNTSLEFEAGLMALADTLIKKSGDGKELEIAQTFTSLSGKIQKEMVDYGMQVNHLLKKYADERGSNDPRYEELKSALTLIDETLYQFGNIKPLSKLIIA